MSSRSLPPLQSEVQAHHQERLRELAERPNTTVLTVEYDDKHDPWPVERVRPMMERLVARVLSFGDEVDDFRVRKTCLDDPEVLAFQRQHPKLYWMLSDRKLMREERCRSAITGLLHVRSKVQSGEVTDEHEADGLATRTVLAALGTAHIHASSPSVPPANPA